MKTKKEFEIIAEHNWLRNCLITESVAVEHSENGFHYKKYTAKIYDSNDNSRTFKIFEGLCLPGDGHFIPDIITKVKTRMILAEAKNEIS